jgi:hypothetical protein
MPTGNNKKWPSRFCRKALRRREIERHALHVGAIDTEDRSRWLMAWLWNNTPKNPKTYDPIWLLMDVARKRMGGSISEAEAAAIVEEAAATTPARMSDDSLAKFLSVTYAQRQALGLRAIGSIDVGKRARKVLRRRKDRLYQEARRRARGARPHSESLSRTKPWKAMKMSRAKWYRQRRETDSSASLYTVTTDLSQQGCRHAFLLLLFFLVPLFLLRRWHPRGWRPSSLPTDVSQTGIPRGLHPLCRGSSSAVMHGYANDEGDELASRQACLEAEPRSSL